MVNQKDRGTLVQTVKSKTDPRHLQRVSKVKKLFAWHFTNKIDPLVEDIIPHIEEIDQLISQSATKWPIKKVNNVDLAILRLACWELLNKLDTPTKVIIDEAIEIAKTYGSSSSSSFVNGALGSLITKIPSRNDQKSD